MGGPRTILLEMLEGEALYREVVLLRMAQARESVWIATANVKAMLVEHEGRFRPLVDLFEGLSARGVELKLLHAEVPSRPFRKFFDAKKSLVRGGLQLKICPRVHFKCVLIDGAWLYVGSANLTGAGLGAKHKDTRNFELGFVSEDFDTIDRVTALYQSIWSGTECARCRLYDVCPDPIGVQARAVKGRKKRGGSDIVLGRSRRLGK